MPSGIYNHKPHSEERKKKISLSSIGKNTWMKGRHDSEEVRKKKSEAAKKGDQCHLWKGGITSIWHSIKNSLKYKEWRQLVFIRDNFCCQKCNNRGGYLQVHHKKPSYKLIQEVKYYLPLFPLYDAAILYTPLWDINNGITLCKKCHRKTKSYGRPFKKDGG